MFSLNPSGRPLSRPGQAPAVQAAPAPDVGSIGMLRVRADIMFKLSARPKGTPGKKDFNMKAVFELDGTTYLTVLDGVRQLCILGRLDMTKSIKFQDGPRLRTVYNMVLETFPGFGEFDDPKWPIEAFIYVVLKGATKKAKKLEKPQAVPAPALTEEEQAARRDSRREAQRKSALARHEACRAAALQAETEDDPETIDIDGANEVDNLVGDIAGLQIRQGDVVTEPPVELPAGTAGTTCTTTRTPAETLAAPADPPVPANLPARPRIRPTPLPRRAPTPLDPAPPAEPAGPTRAPSSAPPAEPAPPVSKPASPAAKPAPAVSTQLATHPPANDTSGRTAGQPFGGPVALTSRSSAVLSRVGSAFLDLGVPDDDEEELSEASTEPEESQPVTAGKGKRKAPTGKGAKGGKAGGDGGAAASKKGGKQGTKKAASTNNPATVATTRARRNTKKT
ncbi:hypothetical protein FRC08_018846 [Ceratobasidium sp. 394]|nr:hypothetical protein FRC08_018846 [Ceratobasidium sp. 394]